VYFTKGDKPFKSLIIETAIFCIIMLAMFNKTIREAELDEQLGIKEDDTNNQKLKKVAKSFLICASLALGIILAIRLVALLPVEISGITKILLMILLAIAAQQIFHLIDTSASCILLLATYIVVVFGAMLLKLIRGIGRRITEYNKGPVAAVMLLLTAILGAWEIYLKKK
jgi:hypothetical protein